VSPCYDVEATPSADDLGTPQICTSVMETRDRTEELALPRHRISRPVTVCCVIMIRSVYESRDGLLDA